MPRIYDPECTCDDEALEDPQQPCPYDEDIKDDPTPTCNCCAYCTAECAMAI